ncbi:MAG: MFS transporter [Candidatus Bipolaricaulia bacterium]
MERQTRILTVLFVGVLMGALDIAVIGPALPAIGAEFDIEARALSWAVTIYVLFNLVGTPLLAKLSDRFGRRWVFSTNVGLFALGSLGVALAPGFAGLLAGRAVQGFGAGGIFPVASAVIGDVFPADRRGQALGMLGAVFGLAFLIGPILGGVLLPVSWRLLFLVNLPVAIGLILAGIAVLPSPSTRTDRPLRPPFDAAGTLTLGLILAGLAIGLDQLDTGQLANSLTSPWVWPFLAIAALLLPYFPRVERRARDPVFPIELLAARETRTASLLAIGGGFLEGALVFIPAMVTVAFGVTTSTASFMLLPAVGAMGLGAPLAGRALDRVGAKRVLLVGTGLLTVALSLLAVVPLTQPTFVALTIGLGLGLSALIGAPVRYVMLEHVSESARASAQGAISMLTRIGLLTSSAAVGALVASHDGLGGFRAAYLVSAGLCLVLLIVTGFRLAGITDRAEPSAERQPHQGTRARRYSKGGGVS